MSKPASCGLFHVPSGLLSCWHLSRTLTLEFSPASNARQAHQMTVFTDLTGRAITAIRRSTPRHKWDEIAEVIVRDRQKVEAELKSAAPQSNFRALLPELRERSHVKIPGLLENAAQLRDYFGTLPVHKGAHVFSFDGAMRSLADVRSDFPMAGYNSDFVLNGTGPAGDPQRSRADRSHRAVSRLCSNALFAQCLVDVPRRKARDDECAVLPPGYR